MKKKQLNKRKDKDQRTDYDSAWKDVIEQLFKHFLEFFFSDIYRDIDFDKKPVFLSDELRKMSRDGKVGKRYADVLVKVHLKDGSVRCIFIHIEVQGQKDEYLPERTYVYNYRIYDHHRELNEEVVSLLILTDEDENFRPDEFYIKRWGFQLRMKIPMVKILDYRDKLEELEQSYNPMAMVVLAQLESFDAKKSDDENKYKIKFNLMRRCVKKGYGEEYIRDLFRFIDWLIILPGKYEKKLVQEIIKLKEETKMPYVASWEREWEKKYTRIGKLEGKLEGIEKQAKETAKRMLGDDFPIEKIVKYTGLSEEEIKQLMN